MKTVIVFGNDHANSVGVIQSFIHRDIKLSTWIKDIRNSKGFMMYFREDCKPFYKQYSNLALSKLHLIKDEPYK